MILQKIYWGNYVLNFIGIAQVLYKILRKNILVSFFRTQCISNSFYLVCLIGARLVEAAFCQPAETYDRAGRQNDDVGLRRLFTLYYCTIVPVLATDGRSNDTLAIYNTNRLSRHRYLQDGGVWHAQPTLE